MIAAVETSPWFDNHPDQAGLWVIEYASERFAVLGLGRIADGRVKAHLASITNYRQQRNGVVPEQIHLDLPLATLAAGHHPE